MKNKKNIMKILLALVIVVCGFLVWTKTYSYDNDKACEYITRHSYAHSHTRCVFFVAKAMWAGGCPMVILMPNGYFTAMKWYGYHVVSENGDTNYVPQKGDIVVLSRTKRHFWGHIAMYTGRQWISDFKQKRMNPYRDDVPYKVYRRNTR